MNLDDTVNSIEFKENSVFERYKYPKDFYNEIFGNSLCTIFRSKSINTYESFLSKKLSLPYHFFSEPDFINARIEFSSSECGLNNNMNLELHEDECELQTLPPGTKSRTEEKISLEDWLDEVL